MATPQDVSSLFQRANDKVESEATNLLLYGSKCGKSWQLGTLGDEHLWICLDPDGYKTIKSPLFEQKIGKVNPYVIEVYEEMTKDQNGFSMPTEAQVYDKIWDIMNYAFRNLLGEFKYVSIDSLTSLSRASILKALDVNAATRRSQAKGTLTTMNALLPGIQDFGTEISLVNQIMDQLISNCKKHNKTLIVTAHERHMYAKNPATNAEEYRGIRPAVTGKAMPDSLSQAFSNVWYMKRVGTGIFRIYTEGDGEYLASTRSAGVYSQIIPDGTPAMTKEFPHGPNLKKILDKIQKTTEPANGIKS